MRSSLRLILIPLFALTALGSTACAPKVAAPSVLLTSADRTRAPDPTPAAIADPLPAPAATGEAERASLFDLVIRPLLDFSVAQERTIAAERQRADAVVAKVDAAEQARRAPRR